MSTPQGLISHIEIGTGDVKAASEFFAALFGWRFVAMDGGGGWFDAVGGKIGLHGSDPTVGVVPYFRVADIEQAVQHVRDLGGEAEAIVNEEGWGKFSNCRDPQGARFGLHQPI